jgi:hypothetical protein
MTEWSSVSRFGRSQSYRAVPLKFRLMRVLTGMMTLPWVAVVQGSGRSQVLLAFT